MTVDSFFALAGQPSQIDEKTFLDATKKGSEIRSKIYIPPSLKSPVQPQRWRIRNCQFVEVSFSKTLIEGFEFKDCTFISCLFIGSIFKDCRFNNCTFTSCNTYRIEFIDVYLDPRSFDRCLDKKRHQNIGVHLYQELLNNSRRQSQPDFAHDALFQFRRWLRFQSIYKLKQAAEMDFDQVKLSFLIILSWINEYLFGFGIRLRNYFVTASLVALIFTLINYRFRPEFGLKIDANASHPFVDALYFTIVTLTTLGYGDITPETPLGRVIVAGEAVFGFVLFAILASMIYRKIVP